jgi:tetratricopeptide (TPR) repeat protein/transcriptional regulator with XRE-family HTH domain
MPDDTPNETFASLLKRLRAAAGLSQHEVADRAGLSTRAVSSLERGVRRRPHPQTVRALATALAVTAEDRACLLLAAARSLPNAAAATGAAPAVAELPMDIGDFTGRDDEVARAVTALTPVGSSAPAVLVVSGKPGVGKSTLAVHVAQRLRAAFPDGQLYAELRGKHVDARDPATVLAGFLRGLGVPRGDLPARLEERAVRFRSLLARRRVLVVLDDVRDEAQVVPLLPGGARCAILLTSRSRLAALPGSTLLELADLEESAGHELLQRIVGSGRVARESEAAAGIVDLCGGLPLALRIAGAALRARSHLTLAAYRDRLSDRGQRLDELRVGDLDVRGAFGLAYDALPDEARMAFRRLGLVPGVDASIGAVAALMDAGEAAAGAAVDRLHEAQLLRATPGRRWGMHDLVRAFAEERLDREEPAEIQRRAGERLLTWYLATARAVRESLASGGGMQVDANESLAWLAPEAARALDWVEAERRNLVAMASRALEEGRAREAREAAELLGAFSELQDDWVGEEEVASVGLRAARELVDEPAEARFLVRLADVDLLTRQVGEAGAHGAAALAIARRLGDRALEGRALIVMGDVHRQALRWSEAEGCHLASLALLSAVEDVYGASSVRVRLAFDVSRQGRWREAMGYLEGASSGFRELGHLAGFADALGSWALVALHGGDYEQALSRVQAGLAIQRKLHSPIGQCRGLCVLGHATTALGRLPEAVAAYEESIAMARRIGDRQGEMWSLNGLGRVRVREARGEQALALHETALAIAEEMGDDVGRAEGLAALGHASLVSRPQEALRRVEESLAVSRRLDFPRHVCYALSLRGHALARLGRPGEAVSTYEEGIAIARQIGSRQGEMWCLNGLSTVRCETGFPGEALAMAERALALGQQLGDPQAQAGALAGMAVASVLLERWERADECLASSLALSRGAGDRLMEGRTLQRMDRAYATRGGRRPARHDV